jgi:hypothetical protein
MVPVKLGSFVDVAGQMQQPVEYRDIGLSRMLWIALWIKKAISFAIFMKTTASPTWIPGLILVMAWLPGGLAQNETNRPSIFAPDATVAATPASSATNPATHVATAPMVISSPVASAATENAVPGNKPLPAKLRLSPWTTEIVKLAESGIEADVMLSFIDNSGMFNLGADQIIYLSDLGVSGPTINAMLQHDREVISGLKPLTIVSEPAWEPALPPTFTASSEASSKTSTQPATAPARPAPVTTESAATPGGEALAEVNHGVADAQPGVLQYAMTNEREPVRRLVSVQPREVPSKKESLYRVREPYPVELLPPIIFINAPERTPNTLIIVGFPQTTTNGH